MACAPVSFLWISLLCVERHVVSVLFMLRWILRRNILSSDHLKAIATIANVIDSTRSTLRVHLLIIATSAAHPPPAFPYSTRLPRNHTACTPPHPGYSPSSAPYRGHCHLPSAALQHSVSPSSRARSIPAVASRPDFRADCPSEAPVTGPVRDLAESTFRDGSEDDSIPRVASLARRVIQAVLHM